MAIIEFFQMGAGGADNFSRFSLEITKTQIISKRGPGGPQIFSRASRTNLQNTNFLAPGPPGKILYPPQH